MKRREQSTPQSFDLATYRTSKLGTVTACITDPVGWERLVIMIFVASPGYARIVMCLRVQNEQIQEIWRTRAKQ